VSGWWAFHRYTDDRAAVVQHQKEADALNEQLRIQQLNSYIYQRQTDLYFDLANTTSILVQSQGEDPKIAHPTEYSHFNALLLGNVRLIADDPVTYASLMLSRCLDSGTCEREKVVNGAELAKPTVIVLQAELVACMRVSLEQNRGMKYTNFPFHTIVCPYIQ
jgi:hypothetical protein